MDWRAVRKTNAARSARKAKREQAEAARKRTVAEHGGPITLAELRGATSRTEPPTPGCCQGREVWTFRGRDWVVWASAGDDGPAIGSGVPYKSYRQDPDLIGTGYGRCAIPMTPAAAKWFAARVTDE